MFEMWLFYIGSVRQWDSRIKKPLRVKLFTVIKPVISFISLFTGRMVRCQSPYVSIKTSEGTPGFLNFESLDGSSIQELKRNRKPEGSEKNYVFNEDFKARNGLTSREWPRLTSRTCLRRDQSRRGTKPWLLRSHEKLSFSAEFSQA